MHYTDFKRATARLLLAACAIGPLLTGATACDDYDDTWIKDVTDDLDKRVEAIEKWQASVNADILSVRHIIKTMEGRDYITGVTPLEDGSGYTVSFAKGGEMVVRHGKPGSTPSISAIKDEQDGTYYWAVDGEPLTDEEGNRLPVTGTPDCTGHMPSIGANGNWWLGPTDTGVGASGATPHIGDNGNWWIGPTDTGVKAAGQDGQDGQDGESAVAPKIRINPTTKVWEISTDGGTTWTSTDVEALATSPRIGDNGNWWIGSTDTGVKAAGQKGEDAVAPQVRINQDTNMWEISADGGTTWTSTGVKATGSGADGLFESIDNSAADYVTFTLAGGATFRLPKIATEGSYVAVATPGTLQAAMGLAGLDEYVTGLTVSGELSDDDFTYLKTLASLRSLDLRHARVEDVPEFALSGMPELRSVVLPADAMTLGKCALAGCTRLSSVALPERLISIGRWVFEGCAELGELELPDGLTELQPSAFYGCGLTEIHIPGSVGELPNWAFEECRRLEKVCIHEGVTAIGRSAFLNCRRLRSIDLPGSVEEIGSEAFNRCHSLEAVVIPQGVTVIPQWCFYDCFSLKFVSLPAGLTTIGEEAFAGCKALQIDPDVKDEYGNAQDVVLMMPASLSSIGIYAFRDCYSLRGVDLTRCTALKAIPDGAFQGCTSLAGATLPGVLEAIGAHAFDGAAFKTITLPASLKSVGMEAFANCDRLTDMRCNAMTAPVITTTASSSPFAPAMKTNCTLSIPTAAAANAYDAWKPYFKAVTR